MNRYIEFILILSKILPGLLVLALAGLMFFRDHFYNRLDKPNSLKHMRILCKVYLIIIILLIIVQSIQVMGFAANTRFYKPSSVFSVVVGWASAIFCVMYYVKFCWYYLKNHDDNDILAGWYMQKYFAMKKNKDNISQAYEYLQKASECKTDSIFIWSMMAMLNERCFDKSDLADEYLTKARQVLNTLDNPTAKDKAMLESATGEILLCRDNTDEGLAHLKNACDLDPSDFNKDRYEKALKWAVEEDESEDSLHPV